MKKLKVEYTAFAYSREPNKHFMQEMSKQISPQIQAMIPESNLKDALFNLLCITLDSESYERLLQDRENQSMRLFLSAISAPLHICSFLVHFSSGENRKVYPWEDADIDSVRFDLQISEYEKKKFLRTLPELYHPLIGSADSGLSFAYQVYFGGSSLCLYFDREITQKDVAEMQEMLFSAFPGIQTKFFYKNNSKQLKMKLDSDKVDDRIIEKVLALFNQYPGLQKLIIR